MKPLGLTRCRLIPQIKAFVHRHWADRSGPSYCRAPIIPMKNTRSPFPDVLIASLLAMTIQSEAPAGTTPPPAPEAAPTPPANPLSFADGRVVLSLENMSRYEFRQNTYDFDSGVDSLNDDSWLLNRFRLGLQWKPDDAITFFFQGQDSREWESRRPNIPGLAGAEGDNPFDLRQASVEIGGGSSPLSLKLGRQTLMYGDQRLVGGFEWNAIARTFDAARVRWRGNGGQWIDGFASSVVVPDREEFDESDRDSVFSGVYAHFPGTGPQATEVYALYLNDDDRDDDFVTVGTHWKSTPEALGPWDYEAEIAYQNGTAGGRDLSAFATYGEVGFTFEHPWKPRAGLEYSYGSGDSDPSDGDEGAFQNLYPTNHIHYGFMDLFSWSNVHDLVLHLAAKPRPQITLGIDLHAFWLADTADSWRRANARTAVRPRDAGASSFAGTEIDLLATWSPNAHVTVTAGWSHFFAGGYLGDTGAGSDADFVYLMTAVKF